MIGHIHGICIVILEVLCCRLFFETFASRRNENHKWRNRGIIASLVLVLYLLVILLLNQFLAKQVLVVIMISVFMFAYAKVDIIKSLILAGLFQGLVLIIDYVCLLSSMLIYERVILTDETYSIQVSVLIVLAKAILFLVILIISKIVDKDSSYTLTRSEWLRFFSFPVFTVGVIIALVLSVGGIENQELETVFFVIAVGLVGLNFVIFYLINDAIKRERKIKEAEIFRLKIENQTKTYRTISENLDEQRKKAHEFNNHIMCIERMLRTNKYEELREYIRSFKSNTNYEQNYISTNNVIVDAILNVKFEEIASKNIAFPFVINDLSGINICDEDIVVILSNLLNNAIEACDKCKGKKVITLKFVIEDDDIIISVKNTFEGEIIKKDGVIQTSKEENLEEHGIGIKNIVDTISKYDGMYIIRHADHEFYFSIIIPR